MASETNHPLRERVRRGTGGADHVTCTRRQAIAKALTLHVFLFELLLSSHPLLATKAGGKVGAVFRDAVRSLAKAEQEYIKRDDFDSEDDHPLDGRETFTDGGAVNGPRRGPRDGVPRVRRRRRPSDARVDGPGTWACVPWRTCLRRVFDRRLDLDGDGYLTEGDLVACLPEIGVDADSRGDTRHGTYSIRAV